MKSGNHFLAGLFIVLGMLLFAVSIWFLGSERQIFSRQEEYYTVFNDVKGLAEGAPVRLGGITIGRVAKIGFADQLSDTRVHVTLLVNDAYLERIREDAVGTIETQGLLGDRFVNISAGTQIKQLLPRSILKSEESGDIASVLTKAGAVVENTKQISEKLNDFMNQVKTETLQSLTDSLKSIAHISREIEEGDGLVHHLIFDKKEGEEIAKSLTQASKGVAQLVDQIQKGNGFLHGMFYGDKGNETVEALTTALKSVGTTSDRVGELVEQVKTGQGLLHQLIYDDQVSANDQMKKGFSQILAKLDDTANNLKLASDSLAKGSGTLGALLVDPSLYDNLVEVTDGAKRSFLLRQAIKSSLNK